MAKGTKNAAVVETTKEEEYVLVLSKREAMSVGAVLGGITGDPSGTVRSLTRGVWQALKDLGVAGYGPGANSNVDADIRADIHTNVQTQYAPSVYTDSYSW